MGGEGVLQALLPLEHEVRLRRAQGALDALFGNAAAEIHVVLYRSRHDEIVLEHDPELFAQKIGRDADHVLPVQQNLPAVRVVKAQKKLHQRALSAARCAQNAQTFPFFEYKRDVLHRRPLSVGEGDVLKLHARRAARGRGQKKRFLGEI